MLSEIYTIRTSRGAPVVCFHEEDKARARLAELQTRFRSPLRLIRQRITEEVLT